MKRIVIQIDEKLKEEFTLALALDGQKSQKQKVTDMIRDYVSQSKKQRRK